MKGRIAVSLKRSADVGQPAVEPATTRNAYAELLRRAAQRLPGAERYKVRTALCTFDRWLDKRGIGPDAPLAVSERLFLDWREGMGRGAFRCRDGKRYSAAMARTVVGVVMRLHDLIGVGKDGVRRGLVDLVSYPRLATFLGLTETTRKSLLWYEDNGTCASARNGERRLQTTKTRQSAISEAFTVLRVMGLAGLELLTQEHVSAYLGKPDEDDPTYRRRYRSLHNLRALTSACCRQGLLPSDPLAAVGNKTFTSCGVKDFVAPEGVDRMLDISTVDLKDDRQATDRLVCLLYLDLALRRDELAALDVGQVHTDAENYEVVLRPEGQKMAGKPSIVLPVYYHQAAELLGHYLKQVRPKAGNGTPSLFVNARGGRLNGPSFAESVRRECERIGVRCFYRSSKPPSPHALRRTFGMVNSAPLGLALPIHEVAFRLRDSIAVVEAHYVRENPLLARMKAETYRRRSNGPTPQDAERALATLRTFGVPDAHLKLAREAVTDAPRGAGTGTQAAPAPAWIAEDEGLARLQRKWSRLPNLRALREHLRSQGLSKRLGAKGALHYAEAWVDRVAGEYRPLVDVIPSFTAKHVERRPWLSGVTLVIGGFILVPVDAALRLVKEANGRRHNPQ